MLSIISEITASFYKEFTSLITFQFCIPLIIIGSYSFLNLSQHMKISTRRRIIIFLNFIVSISFTDFILKYSGHLILMGFVLASIFLICYDLTKYAIDKYFPIDYFDNNEENAKTIDIKMKYIVDGVKESTAIIPIHGSRQAAGYDLCSVDSLTIPPNGCARIPTGLALEIPKTYCGMIVSRSGLAFKEKLFVTGLIGIFLLYFLILTKKNRFRL